MKEAELILEKLKNLNSLEAIRDFISLLGFSYADDSLSTRNFKQQLKDAIEPGSLRIIGRAATYPVVFFKKASIQDEDIDKQLIRLERELIKKLPTEIQDASIVIAASPDFQRVHFINAKRTGSRLILRRYLIGKDQNMRTAAERLAFLKLDGVQTWDQVISRVDEAFDREEVTEKFFKDFERVFKSIKDEIVTKQKIDEHLAHQFLHACLNRLMFIYYVQRKGWLADGDIEFIKTLWTTYQNGDYPENSFYENWLRTLFFYAFNNEQGGIKNKGLPKDIERYFADAPYLNGGLFKERFGIDNVNISITDDMFQTIFEDILNHYNFTVTEDTPFDQNIAVDPEMLGIVYESLVNTTELSDERKDSGIFYTPRIEVDFMCRRTLVEYLANHSSATREDIYRFVFPSEGELNVPNFTKKIRKELNDALLNVTVVDPACGSGAFLVGMMQVILELRQMLAKQDNAHIDEFNEKKRIIERSLYGVDVKEWAVNVAQLRLWLTLIEVADDKILDLQGMKYADEALLPSLAFKLRDGDSLVQEIAGITIPVRHTKGLIAPQLQTKITFLRKAKTDFYFNNRNLDEDDLKLKERALYESILDHKISAIEKEIKSVVDAESAGLQQQITDVLKPDSERKTEFQKHHKEQHEKSQKRIQKLTEEKKELERIKKSLPEKKQLFWSIEFAEIFSERGGFDIVIGNPPYVKKEKIADPRLMEKGIEPDVEEKREYKDKLERMIRDDWGSKFGRVDKKSDLYVYFYLKGLQLLNSNGVFCYISSNSWLDVGYGKGLQEFLLMHGFVYGIYDNEVKRSFKRADVNTIIAVLGSPKNGQTQNADHIARFIMFKQPFEAVVNSDLLIRAEKVEKRELLESDDEKQPQARVVAMNQAVLFREGVVLDEEDEDKALTKLQAFDGVYEGNKWGGKYLRAPDIFWQIIEKHAGLFTQLKENAEVIGYVHDNNTGKKYPKTYFVKTVKDMDSVLLRKNDSCVIQFGVNPKGNSKLTAPILFPRTLGERHIIPYNPDGVIGKEFYRIIPDTKALMSGKNKA